MTRKLWPRFLSAITLISCFSAGFPCSAEMPATAAKITVNPPGVRAGLVTDDGPGWKKLTLDDFENVNCDPETWSMRDGLIHCTGLPIGVTKSKEIYKNIEVSVEWRHNKFAGNSGMFLWADPQHLTDVKRNALPRTGIEIQMLDHGYAVEHEKRTGKKGDWFTTNGDIFPLTNTKLTLFEPRSPNGSRSFPRHETTRGHGEWNHYYLRAINGEVRLWVNGVEVSGGNNADPAEGHLLLESEGSPIDFRDLKIRRLP